MDRSCGEAGEKASCEHGCKSVTPNTSGNLYPHPAPANPTVKSTADFFTGIILFVSYLTLTIDLRMSGPGSNHFSKPSPPKGWQPRKLRASDLQVLAVVDR